MQHPRTLRRKIGVVSHWRHVVAHLPQNVRDFNVKLLGTSNGDAPPSPAEAPPPVLGDFVVQGAWRRDSVLSVG